MLRTPLSEVVAHLREGCVMCQQAAETISEAEKSRYIFLNCHCTQPLAIRIDSIEHGLKAGWQCSSCGQTLMLSDFARASEALAADPCLAAVTRGVDWYMRHGCEIAGLSDARSAQ